jgi:hypothetical protein
VRKGVIPEFARYERKIFIPQIQCVTNYIEFFVGSLLLEPLTPIRLGVACEPLNLVEDHKKVCITRSFEQRLVCGLAFVVGKGRIRVERDPALCGRLNEELGHLLWCDRTSG